MKASRILLALLSAIVSFNAQANILYSFDTDAQDWTLSDGTLTYVSSGGNTGGYVNTTDINSNDMALHAPTTALGNWTQYLGGTLSFDALNTSNQQADWNGFGLVTLSNGSLSVTLDLEPNLNEPPANGLWKTYSAVLSNAVWGSNLTSVLSNVTSVTVTTEDHVSSSFSDEQVGFDNFSVTAVPEPESYAMLLAGLGLIGVATARRKLK